MIDRQQVRALLMWHVDSGVDETITDQPQNRFGEPEAALSETRTQPVRSAPKRRVMPGLEDQQAPVLPTSQRQPAKPEQRPPTPRPVSPAEPPPSGEASLRSAVEQAGEANTVAELRAALENFDGCALKKTAMNLVFTDGSPDARLMFVGEAPGAQEDRQGLPFVGPSGHLLDKMLDSIGIERADVLISNTVFWRPPGNRTPTPQETAVCMPFMERLIELVDPDVLVTLGGPAAKALLGETQGVGRLRGRWFTYQTPRMSHPVEATAMFHPAYLLRTPAQKRAAWQDMLGIKAKLGDISAGA